ERISESSASFRFTAGAGAGAVRRAVEGPEATSVAAGSATFAAARAAVWASEGEEPVVRVGGEGEVRLPASAKAPAGLAVARAEFDASGGGKPSLGPISEGPVP